MNWKKLEFWLAMILVIYLLFVGLGAAMVVIANFPTESLTEKGTVIVFSEIEDIRLKMFSFGKLGSVDRGLLLLAFFAGIAGSFLHAAQSLSSYVGNAEFKASWTTWYFLRPWIGGVLGFAIYFALRAGLIAGVSGINPYGVVALGLLGGWFSKTTTDKLQEVFDTLFKTDEDKKRKNKLQAAPGP